MKPRTLTIAGLAGLAAAYAEFQWLGRTYGASPQERRRQLPGDDLCPDPQAVTTHATTIKAPARLVWPWLVQLGWGRGQWYTARWVDKLLFPDNGPSADRLHPEWQDLKIGDRILDGAPEKHTAFTVAMLEPNRHLVLHSREHLPPTWAERYGATINWSWAFVLDELPDGQTRFILRSRLRLEPRWVEACYLAAIVPADFVMSRQLMRGLTTRVEGMSGAHDTTSEGTCLNEGNG
jgi:hypothetical protein